MIPARILGLLGAGPVSLVTWCFDKVHRPIDAYQVGTVSGKVTPCRVWMRSSEGGES